MKFFLILNLFLIFLFSSCQNKNDISEKSEPNKITSSGSDSDTSNSTTVIFETLRKDTSFSVRFKNNEAHLDIILNGKSVSHFALTKVESGSGAKYSDGKITFWNKGKFASFETPSGVTIISEKGAFDKSKVSGLSTEDSLNIQNFTGDYFNGDYPNSYWQMISVKTAGNIIKVSITASKAGDRNGCEFNGLGIFKNGNLEVPLNQGGYPTAKGILLVKLTDNGINADVKDSKDANELLLFCQGGASIGGDYIKKIIKQ